MKRALGILFSALLSGLTALAGGSGPDSRSVPITWSPSPSQVRAWTDPEALSRRSSPPVVSVKVPVPAWAEDVALTVKSSEWTFFSGETSDPPEDPPCLLGPGGTWEGVAFREVLVHPVRSGGEGSPGLLLTRLQAAVSWSEEPAEAKPDLCEGRLHRGAGLFAAPLALSGPSTGPAPSANAPEQGLASPPQGLRIRVTRDGIVRLGRDDLVSFGFLPDGIPLEDFHLTSQGVEVPLAVEGPETGPFGPGHALVFYGQKADLPNRNLFNGGDFTEENVYWLTSGGGTPGLRMDALDGAPGRGFTQATQFVSRQRVEANTFFFNIYHYRPNGDLWYFGSPVYKNQPRTYVLPLPHSASGSVTVEALIAALSSGTHSLQATLNGVPPAAGPYPAAWSGLGLSSFQWTFEPPIVPGDATLTLTVPGTGDYLIPDYFDVSYARDFTADGGSLSFSDAGPDARYVVPGLAFSPWILDLSRMDAATGLALPRLVTGAAYDAGSGSATFEMAQDPLVPERRVAVSSAPLLPDSAEMASPRDLSSPSLGADLLLLTHPDFHPEGADSAWQDFVARRSGEMAVESVDIQEVYDNYSHGIFDPTAIRSFLEAAAAHWTPAPRYVLLIGDATYDYKNANADTGLKNWVPTMMFEDLTDSTYMGRYPSDAWYGDVNGDGFPDMAVGRLPVRTYEALEAVLDKIAAYEDQTLAGAWYKTGLFLADTYTQWWEQEFEFYNTYLRDTFLGPPWQNLHVYFHDAPYNGTDADACAAAIRSGWPQSALVHYSGHSGVAFYGKSYAIFTAFPSRNCGTGTCLDSDVDLLPSIVPGGAPLPFVVNSSCYNSAFNEVGTEALMEALVARGDGGAIGSSGFSTIAYQDEEEAFNTALFLQAFGAPKVRRIGDLVEAGRFALPSTVSRAVLGNVLLGDPTLKLRLPAPPAPEGLTAASNDGAVALEWTAPSPAPSSYAVYRSEDAGQTWTQAGTPSGGATAFAVTGLTNGQAYSFYMTGVDVEGFEGPPSDVVSATPAPVPCSLACEAAAPSVASTGSASAFDSTLTSEHCAGSPSYLWDFGDGYASTEADPVHVYTAPGAYNWSLTVSQDGAVCQETGSLTAVVPPTVTSVKKVASPFRIILTGGNFHSDVAVYVDGAPWPTVTWKSASKVVLKGGATLKAEFPSGVPVSLRLVNGDGGETTVVYTRP
ncbi:MAG: C25 family cysteine peptidase [Acidobacteriota bacterium]